MAWEQTLLECSFRGVVFDVEGVRDSYSRAVSVAEYPYQDGGEATDLGARPAVFSLRAIWFGDDYEERMREALTAFAENGTGELIHPIWGSIPRAQFLGADISHEAMAPDSAVATLRFLESAAERSFFEKSGAAQVQETVGAPGDEAVDASTDAVEDVVTTVRDANPLETLDTLRQAMLGPLLALTAEVQGVIASGLDVLDYPRAWARDIASLSNGTLAIANFPDRLKSEWDAITGVFKGIKTGWGWKQSTGYSPWQTGSTPSEAQAAGVIQAHMSVAMATAQAEATAAVLAAEAESPSLSPLEIEALANDTRAELDEAMEAVRGVLPLEQARTIVEPLKDQALAVQEAAQAIIEARPPLVTRTLTAPGNLRLVAHRLYGDHTRAPELWRLNQLRRPNSLQPGDTLHAYAR